MLFAQSPPAAPGGNPILTRDAVMNRPVICPHCKTPIVDTSGFAEGAVVCPGCAENVEQSMVAGQSPEWVAEQMKAHPSHVPARKQNADGVKTAQAVMDVVAGVNWRWRDNLIQAIAIFVSIVIGAVIGPIFTKPEVLPGVLAGGFVGMVGGLFLSGIVLMIYRLFRH